VCVKGQLYKQSKGTIMNKRISAALTILVIAALMAAAGTQFNALGGGASAPQLEGTWEVTVMPDGGAPIVDLATFSSGGGMVNSDPDPNLSTGHGTWAKNGGNEFGVTFIHFLSDQGAPLGTLKVRAVTQLDTSTDTFSGPFRTDVIIGGNVVQSFCGTVHARRISVEEAEACP
jgi:hypothetical protein